MSTKPTIPKTYDPISIYYDQGTAKVKESLAQFDHDQLVLVAKTFTALKSKETKCTDEALIAKIALTIKSRANQGAAFGDYKLPD